MSRDSFRLAPAMLTGLLAAGSGFFAPPAGVAGPPASSPGPSLVHDLAFDRAIPPQSRHGVGSASHRIVHARTPLETLVALVDVVEDMVESGAISPGTAERLRIDLNIARRHLERGDPVAARYALSAFTRLVEAFAQVGFITDADGGSLIDQAETIIDTLESEP